MTVVAKLGSSIVAGEDGALREDVLDGVCAQVAELHAGGENVVMVTSGAIARGMRLLELPRRPAAIDELQAASAVGQGSLFRAYEERLAAGDVRAAQVLLTASDLQLRTHYLNARQTLRRLLDWRAVPVVNENDTTATDEITFGDNDFLAAQVAIMLEARLIVLLTDQPGLYTRDPRRHPNAELVPEVRSDGDLEAYEIGEHTSPFGLGGMRSKVAAAGMAGAAGIDAVICDGTAPGTLIAAAAGEPTGTRFHPHPERASSFKLWLRYAKPSHGSLRVDDGAARVLRERGSSLLPVGITEVEGEFAAGDAVEVTLDGETIGKGIVNYSAEELRRVKGMRTEKVRELLPHASEEAVHRDYFVLTKESSGPPRDTARAMSKENVESFKRGTELLNRRDIESFLEMLDPEVEWYPGLVALLEGETTVYRGREEVRALFQDIFEAFADFRFEFSEIRDLGDRILAVGEMRGRGTESGAEIESPWAFLIQLRNGKATDVRVYLDTKEALETAGLSE